MLHCFEANNISYNIAALKHTTSEGRHEEDADPLRRPGKLKGLSGLT
jgi:hypothetical protein